ncbi:glycosyltransferase family 4 protein [Lutibacter sp.]|uniref:glycosyltransferase family 4 protein n=1 Tax=Lutibacter sp. TaxID=1925666 RepID=UPI002734694A|nr:glycosyltransferase family 4 protein [Lutibacter sp.]MDP3312595.1 glycosyltransferase family 4 protein [Lutibacter sp.]
MNSKKILIVTSEFPPQPGGIGNHAFNLATQLQLHGYEVGVLTDERSKDGFIEKQFDLTLPFKVYRTKRFRISLCTYLMRILVYNRIIKNYSKVIASGKFPLWLVGFYPLKNKKIKLAIIHGSEVNLTGVYRKITNKALRYFDTVVAVSNFTKALVAFLDLKNIHVIPNGFEVNNETKEFHSMPIIKKNDPTLITVGNVSERKGQLNVIKALPQLSIIYSDIHYHIVGIPSEQEAFEHKALSLGVLKNITFHGIVTEQKKYELLQKSDLFIMLSNSTSTGDVEGFGIAILEANALGLPAIGSRNCGIEDAILHENSGLLVTAENSEEFCKAVQLIWNDLSNYKNNAMKWSNQFKWEKIIHQYLKLINY